MMRQLGELVKASDFTPQEKTAMWADIERMDPQLWRRCYPKIYRDYKPNEYYSPKETSREIYSIAKKIEMGYVGESEKYEMLWAVQMAAHRVPVYWVTRDLVTAIQQTVPPMEYDYYNAPLPFPGMSFMLPKASLTHPQEGDVQLISFARHRANVDTKSFIPYGPHAWASINGGMVITAKTNQYFHHWNIPYSDIKIVDLAALDAISLRFDDNPHSSGWLSNPAMTKEDTQCGAQVAHLLFGLLVLMETRPDLVTKAALEKRVPAKAKDEPPKEFWSPAIIGKDYKIRREYAGHGGTHASPMSHWVRGHYREQAHGPKLSLHKRIWIEPFWKPGSAA